MKRLLLLLLVGVLATLFCGCAVEDTEAIAAFNSKIDTLTTQNQDLTSQLEKLQGEKEGLELLNQELQSKIDEAAPWFELSDIEKEAKETELQAIKEAEEAELQAIKEVEEEAAKLKAEEERAAKEAEEKLGYDTGITYDQLARNPDDYAGKKVKFKGKVLQVLEGDGSTDLRIAVNSDYDNVIYVSYVSDILDSRVLEDDILTVMGTSAGLLSYQSTMGGTITIPSIVVLIIET